jgi:hypothetical protein
VYNSLETSLSVSGSKGFTAGEKGLRVLDIVYLILFAMTAFNDCGIKTIYRGHSEVV